MSHITYRYWCPTELAWVEEVRLSTDPIPTVCVNEGTAFSAGSLTIVQFPEEFGDIQFIENAVADFNNANVIGLSHTSLEDIGTNTHAQIDAHVADATRHRQINDGANGTTDLWSANKISTQLAGKASTIHTHVAADITNFSTAVSANTDVAASVSHTSNTSNPHNVTKAQVGLSNVPNTKVNLVATTNPAVTDDSTAGYAVGSTWIDTTAGKQYVLVDASVGAAVWHQTDIITHSDLSGVGSNTHTQIDSHIADATRHRQINDSANGTTDLWSASKISTQLAGKANTTHTHVAADVTDFISAADARITAQKGAANGIATLDAAGKIPSGQLPALAVTTVTVAADTATRNALSPNRGDVVKVVDSDGSGHPQTYIYDGSVWIDIQETSDVISVNGQTGTVSLTTSNITEGSNLYYTAARVTAHTEVSQNTTHRGRTDNPHNTTKTQVGLGNVENLKVNLTATADPTISDSVSSGYAVGSRWINVTGGKEFVLVDSTAGAAVWRRTDISSTTDITEGTNLFYTETRVSNNSAVSASTAHSARTDNPHNTTKTQVGLGNVANLKVNLVATTNPAVSDDSVAGYAIGSRWFNTTLLQEYVCVSASAGAAIWKPTTKQFEQVYFPASTNSATYVVAGTYLYRGASYRTIKSIRVIAAHSTTTAGYTFDVRVIDYDNSGALVAEVTGLSGTSKAIRDLGTISNVPTSDHVFEVQIKRSGTTSGTNLIALYSVAFEFN